MQSIKHRCVEIQEISQRTKTYQKEQLEYIQGQISKIRNSVEDNSN